MTTSDRFGECSHSSGRRPMAAVLETGHSRADFLIDLMTGDGRVLPATSLDRAAAVQRIAGIQHPLAVGSVRLWTERPPRVDLSSERPPLMMYFQRSTTGTLSHPLPFHSLARRGAKKRDAPECPDAWERGNLPSARPIRRSPGNPHGCWTSHLRFTVNSKFDPTVNFRRELNATL